MSNLPTPSLMRRVAAEAVGTFWLILAGCGTAVLAATSTTAPDSPALFVGVGYVGVALAFGLAVATMAYGLGHISGGHFNPAVSLGLAMAGRLSWRDLPANNERLVAEGKADQAEATVKKTGENVKDKLS